MVSHHFYVFFYMATPSILIVEDETVIARELESMLAALGYEVMGFTLSGEAALRFLDLRKPNLVLMDIVLQGEMDGVETATAIRGRWSIPVVYVTGYADAATIDRVKRTEPYGYILKPFSEEDLKVTIELALHRHRSDGKPLSFRDLVTSEELRALLPPQKPAGSTDPVPISEPSFVVGSRVCELALRMDSRGQRIKGTVTKVYTFGDRYRYVVAFDDGKDGVFFDSEITYTDD